MSTTYYVAVRHGGTLGTTASPDLYTIRRRSGRYRPSIGGIGVATKSIVVPLRKGWDSLLTYDAIVKNGDRPGIFVGRRELLEPLVATIADRDKRGTVLVSGHRGTGKTTLVIEALRQARRALARDSRRGLLPIVLNVSEVATSLHGGGAAGQLDIDPKRLLVSLLRAFRQRRDLIDEAEEARRDQIDALYLKATAAEFRALDSTGATRTETLARSSGASVRIDEAFKGLLAPAGILGASILGASASNTLSGDLVRGGLAVLALAAAGFGLHYSTKRSRDSKTERAELLSIAHDNSLQQLENDLKDLLQALHADGWRTVVVLEELDKLNDQGKELESIVRYFKNLFTQAPALFVFVTDKYYYDHIERGIRAGRRNRTYATSHTFYTYRVFVDRPTTAECLEFMTTAFRDEEHKAIVRTIHAGDNTRVALESYNYRKSSEARVPLLSLFVRVLLLQSSNHLFDLKALLQRYVRPSGGVDALHVDDETFPPEERTLAKFQDLVEEKFRTYQRRAGRAYANEVLRSCLYGVFFGVGEVRSRPVSELLPQQEAGSGPDVADGEPLDSDEMLRVRQAVASLLDDLVRGKALKLLPANSPGDTSAHVQWLPRPAEAFQLVQGLQSHEIDLVARYSASRTKMQKLWTLVPPDARLTDELRVFDATLARRIRELEDFDTAITIDAAESEAIQTSRRMQEIVARLQVEFSRVACEAHGLDFESAPVGSFEPGSGIRMLRTRDGDLREGTSIRGGTVLLVQGTRDDMFGAVQHFLEKASCHRRAIVHVVDEAFVSEEARSQLVRQWVANTSATPASPDAPHAGGRKTPIQRRVTPVSLTDLGTLEGDVGPNQLARHLLVATLWAARPGTGAVPMPDSDSPLAKSVALWLSLGSDDAVRVIDPDIDDVVRRNFAVRMLIWAFHPRIAWVLPIRDVDFFLNPVAARETTLDDLISVVDGLVPGGSSEQVRRRAMRLAELLLASPQPGGETGVVLLDQPIGDLSEYARYLLKGGNVVANGVRDDRAFVRSDPAANGVGLLRVDVGEAAASLR